MPRRRASVPSSSDVDYTSLRKGKKGGRAFDSLVLQAEAPTRKEISQQDLAAKARTLRDTSVDVLKAMEDAKLGDDQALLPYQPTPSINPPRPRTLAAGYDPQTKTLRVRFRDGTPWAYYDVEPREWRNFTRVKSPGRYINRTLNQHPYSRDDF